MPKLKILLVEDHALTRLGLVTSLNSFDLIESVIEAEDAESAIEIFKQEEPDIILMDLGLAGMNGIEATKKLKEIKNNIKIIILTSHNSEEESIAAIKAGASAYCLKDIPRARLFQVIETVSEGAAWIDPAVADVILKKLAVDFSDKENEVMEKDANLTDREKEVLKLLAAGYSNSEMASRMCVSINTVKVHIGNILQKLEVEDRTQAAIKALKLNIV